MASSDADLIAAAKECVRLVEEAESANRLAFREAVRFVSGEQWSAADIQSRGNWRPMHTINKTEAFIRQVINGQKQNRPGIKVHPVDSGADIDSAMVRQGIIRNIEVDSQAYLAYDHAVEQAAIGGWGYFRVRADYVDEASFDQHLRVEMIEDTLSVYFDPHSQYPTGQDGEWCLVVSTLPRKAFERQFPKASSGGEQFFSSQAGSLYSGDEDTLSIAEYYYVDYIQATLVQFDDGTTAWKDQLPPTEELQQRVIRRERASSRRQVKWCKLTSAEVLMQRDIPGRYIPIVRVAGTTRLVDGKRKRYGMTAALMDSAIAYNYARTAMTEFIAMMPRARWKAAAGQVEQYLEIWENSTRGDTLVLPYNPLSHQGIPVPPPEYIPFDGPPQALVQMALSASDDMKSSVGIYDPSLGQRSNETSGVAIRGRQRQGEIANFHYEDNLKAAIVHAGRILLDQIPVYYGEKQVLHILGEDGEPAEVRVNEARQTFDSQGLPVLSVLNDLTGGRYDVTISAGPSYQTKRQESADSLIDLARSFPKIWDIAGHVLVKSLDIPEADAVADLLRRALPPELQDQENEDEMPQKMARMEQALQQALQNLQALNAYAQQQEQALRAAQQAEQEATQKLAARDAELHLKRRQQDIDADIAALNLALAVLKLQPAEQQRVGEVQQELSALMTETEEGSPSMP